MQHACFVINDFNFLLSHRLDLLIGLSKKIDITVICSIKDNQRNKIHYIKNQNISLIEVQSRKNIFDSFFYLGYEKLIFNFNLERVLQLSFHILFQRLI